MTIKFARRTMLKLTASMPVFSGIGSVVAASLGSTSKSFNYYKITERKAVPYITTETRLRNAGIAFVEGGDRVVRLEGNPGHMDTMGSLTGPETTAYLALNDPDRLTEPLKRAGKRGAGKWKPVSWDEALSDIATHIGAALDQGAANSICLNLGKDLSGGAWQRFMDSIGSASVYQSDSMGDLNKRIGMTRAWGRDIEIPDFGNSRYILVFGSDPFQTFHPFNRWIARSRIENEAKLVVFDVRTSFTSGLTQYWEPIFPGTDGIVALAIAHVILTEGLTDTTFIELWTDTSVGELSKHLMPFTPEAAEKASGVLAQDIRRIAREFATYKPASVFSYRGATAHVGGADTARACLLLAALTGNIEQVGGTCLPRSIDWQQPEPVPKTASGGLNSKLRQRHLLPFLIHQGKQACSVLFNVRANPAFSNPAAAAVRAVLGDESIVPLLVDVNTHISETASLADYVLPEAHYLERLELDSGPSLYPWIGLRQPVVKPAGQARDARLLLKDLAWKLDLDGKRDIRRFWDFDSVDTYVAAQVARLPEDLVKAGGLDVLKKQGFWPAFGVLDEENDRIVDAQDKPVVPKYRLHEKGGFATASGKMEFKGSSGLPSWKPNPRHSKLGRGELVMVAYKAFSHVNSLTANDKYLQEINHSNPALINTETAIALGISDGELVRVSSEAGYMITRARVTEGLHPSVLAISSSMGHRAFGRVARGRPHDEVFGKEVDPDIEGNLWWRNNGASPNDIMPLILDPDTAVHAWNDVVVHIAPAQPDDKYGDIRVEISRQLAQATKEITKLRLGESA